MFITRNILPKLEQELDKKGEQHNQKDYFMLVFEYPLQVMKRNKAIQFDHCYPGSMT